MKFTEIFKKSWKDYTENFNAIFKFMFLFNLSPLIILYGMQWIWALFDKDVLLIFLNPVLQSRGLINNIPFFIFSIILGIISLFISFFVYAGFTSAPLKKAKFKFKDLTSEGSSFYFKYLGFTIVMMIFLLGLFILLIIPGIIFLIYWIFGIYVYYEGKNGIRKSLKRSRELVKGRWWRIFGYFILIILILSLIQLLGGLIALPTTTYILTLNLNGVLAPVSVSIINNLLELLTTFLVQLINLPLFFLFFKNLYLELKEKKKDKVKP